ncbi:MAG: class D beta-lactamase [Bacteroidota bacterium]
MYVSKSLSKVIFFFFHSVVIIQLLNAQQNFREIPGLSQYFKEYDVVGSFVLYDLNNDSTICYNRDRITKEFIPASTFKIPNSLIALETGVVTDENFVIKWDSTLYGTETWNRDHTLKTAFTNSVVWYYQEIARRIGPERMQHFLDTMQYGNRNISGGIDRFWLEGGLRISQIQQIDFLRRLYTYQLPISKRSIDILKKIMVFEKTDAYTLSAKTGLALRAATRIGWLVGYLERGRNVYFFATIIEQKNAGDLFGNARLEITRKIFHTLKLM